MPDKLWEMQKTVISKCHIKNAVLSSFSKKNL